MYKLITNLERWETIYVSALAPEGLVDQVLTEPPSPGSRTKVTSSGRYLVETLALHAHSERPGVVLLMCEPQWLLVISSRLRLLCADQLAAIAAAQRFSQTTQERAALANACRDIDASLRPAVHIDAPAERPPRSRRAWVTAAALALLIASSAWMFTAYRRLARDIRAVNAQLSTAAHIETLAGRTRQLDLDVSDLESKLTGNTTSLVARVAKLESTLNGHPGEQGLDNRAESTSSALAKLEGRLRHLTDSLVSLEDATADRGGAEMILANATDLVRLLTGENSRSGELGGISGEMLRLRNALGAQDDATLLQRVAQLVDGVVAVNSEWRKLDGEKPDAILSDLSRELLLAREAIAMTLHASRHWKVIELSHERTRWIVDISVPVPLTATGLTVSLSGQPSTGGGAPPTVWLQRFRVNRRSGQGDWVRVDEAVVMSGRPTIRTTALPRVRGDNWPVPLRDYVVEVELLVEWADNDPPRSPATLLVEVWPLADPAP